MSSANDNNKVRVAAVQFGVTADVQANLATCLRMIDRAAQEQPVLMVLPEFCNHLAWYNDRAHSYQVAVPLGGAFLNAVAAKAAEHRCFIKLNCTVQRADDKVTGTNILFDPQGRQLAVNDKQTLMGNENNFLERAREHGAIPDTAVGRIGMYACADGLLNETARVLAVRGAQVLLNSLNSFAACEAALHVPVRAAENRVFVIAANKVAPLIPPAMIEAVSQRIGVAVERLCGAGESQIVAPEGTVLAKGPKAGEAVVLAEIDPAQADDKKRPDGTDVFAERRPELYAPLAQAPGLRNYTPGAAQIAAAVYQSASSGAAALAEVAEAVQGAASAGIALLVLPELFCFAQGVIDDPHAAVALSQQAIKQLSAALQAANSDCAVGASLIEPAGGGFQHVGVLINHTGVRARQPQLHRSKRHAAWATVLGQELKPVDLPWGRAALVVGDDALYPETFRLAALQNVEVVAAPLQLFERWEMEFGLLERAAENRLSIVAATRPVAALGEFGASAILTVGADFTLWTEWKNRPFDGYISYPLVTRAAVDAAGLTRAPVYPANAGNRLVSQQTDLVDGRPWWLLEPLLSR